MYRAYIDGLMAEYMKVNGKIKNCMAWVFTNGKMGNYIKVNIKMIKNMDLEYMSSMTAELMKVGGLMGSSMA